MDDQDKSTTDFWDRYETEKLQVVRKPVRGRGGKHRKYTFKWSDERRNQAKADVR